MRVHLGSDHAGLDLKDHLVSGSGSAVTSPSTTARSSTTPSTTTRSSASAPPRVWSTTRSLGVVIGGSGNGEQIAANKVDRSPVRAGLERRDGGTRPPAQRRQRALRRRPDAHARGDDPLRRHLPGPAFTGEERHVRRIAMLTDYESTGDLPPLPTSALGHDA